MMQALRSLALHTGGDGSPPVPLPAGCCPGDLAELLEFVQVTLGKHHMPSLQHILAARVLQAPPCRLRVLLQCHQIHQPK